MENQKTELKITERGNGLPSVGELVYDLEADTVYRITSEDGNIHTGGSGDGNYYYCEGEEVGDASDLTDEEWEDLFSCRVEDAS